MKISPVSVYGQSHQNDENNSSQYTGNDHHCQQRRCQRTRKYLEYYGMAHDCYCSCCIHITYSPCSWSQNIQMDIWKTKQSEMLRVDRWIHLREPSSHRVQHTQSCWSQEHLTQGRVKTKTRLVQAKLSAALFSETRPLKSLKHYSTHTRTHTRQPRDQTLKMCVLT